MTTPLRKKILHVHRQAPHGSSSAQEALDMLLISAAFEQELSVLFIDDGVYQLLSEQDPQCFGRKNFSKTFRALEHYDVHRLYVEDYSLHTRGLGVADLLLPVTCLSSADCAALMQQHDMLLNF